MKTKNKVIVAIASTVTAAVIGLGLNIQYEAHHPPVPQHSVDELYKSSQIVCAAANGYLSNPLKANDGLKTDFSQIINIRNGEVEYYKQYGGDKETYLTEKFKLDKHSDNLTGYGKKHGTRMKISNNGTRVSFTLDFQAGEWINNECWVKKLGN